MDNRTYQRYTPSAEKNRAVNIQKTPPTIKPGDSARSVCQTPKDSRARATAKRSSSALAPASSGKAAKKVTLKKVVRSSFSSGGSDASIKTVKATKRKPFPISVIMLALVITALFMFMVLSYVQINEYTLEVSGLRSDISELASERKDITQRLDEKNDMLEIEKYATENLHMVKIDQLTKKHISIDREDKIEVVETEPSEDQTVVTTVMSSFFSNFNGLVEYLG